MTTADDTVSPRASRRDALKMTGVAAAGAAAFWSGLAALSQTDAGASSVVSHATSGVPASVVVTINGVKIQNVTVAGYAESDIDVVAYTPSGTTQTRYRAGNNKTTRIKITREWSNDTTFIDWYQGIAAGKADERTLVISILGPKSAVIAKLTATNVWPFSWVGPAYDKSLGSAHATESITLSADSFEYS